MRWLFYLLLVLLTCLVQHGPLALWPWAPDLPLALLAWALVDGDDRWLVERAMLLGLVRDCCDPAASGFHLVTCTGLAVGALWARQWFYRRRASSWVIAAVVVTALVSLADGLLGGWGDRTALVLAIRLLTTAGACVVLAWLCDALPDRFRPVGAAGA